MLCLLTAALLAVFAEQTCASLRVTGGGVGVWGVGVGGRRNVEGMCLSTNRIIKVRLIKIYGTCLINQKNVCYQV